MAKRTETGNLKMKFIRILAVLMILCLAAFTFVACGDDDKTSNSSGGSYTKTEIDEGVISNASFEFGSAGLTLSDYPQISPKNWSVTTDNAARSSYVNSGIVDVSEDGWAELLNTLYDDNDFLQYCVKKFDIDLDQIKTDKNNDTKLVKEAVVDILKTQFVSPSAPTTDSGNKVLMINNYLDSIRYGQGTAQKATSSSTITVKKGTIARISVYVKTKDVVGTGKFGANIRINSIVNSVSMNEFAIYGIKDTDWTEYSFYVKGDENYDATVSLTLGLGFGSTKGSDFTNDYTQGTVYFDDIKHEVVDTLPASYTAKQVDVINKDSVYVDSTTNNPVFDLDVNSVIFATANSVDAEFNNNVTVTHGFHKSNVTQDGNPITSQTVLGAANSTVGYVNVTNNNIRVTDLKNASYAITLTSPEFTLESESYAFVTFNILNELGILDKNGITVYVYDVNDTEEIVTSVGNFTYIDGKTQQVSFLIKNNFPEKDPDNTYPATRKFEIKIVIGKTDITTASKAVDFSNGNVTISDLKLHFGKTYQYERFDRVGNESYKVSTTQMEDYNAYSFANTTCANSLVALYAGNSADFTSSSTSHTISVAPSDIGTIVSAPALIKGYEGITSDHVYITDESVNSTVNDRVGIITGNDHAGVINSKYLTTYKTIAGLSDIETALNHNGDKDIQPLMIYNDTASSYGFIGTSVSVASGSFASVSLKIRVVGNASASIYLVDTANADKDVMEISFTENTDGYKYVDNGAKHTYKLAFENITADKMDTTGADKGWLTLTFYVATGKTAKNFRLEMWNGSRTGDTTSAGYVFINDINVSATSAFSEPTDWTSAFTASGSVLNKAFIKDASILDTAVLYKRVLDKTEIKFNNEQEDAENKVTYDAKYVWAKNDSTIYAVYKDIDPVAVDPYADVTDTETEEEEKNCTAKSDPSTFWVSFSSIVLVVALAIALIMLIVKHFFNKRKKDKKVKSGYNVSSRYTAKTKAEKAKKVKKDNSFDDYEGETATETEPEETAENTAEEVVSEEPETTETTVAPEEQTLDEFVYGDVQDFGDYEDNSDKPE